MTKNPAFGALAPELLYLRLGILLDKAEIPVKLVIKEIVEKSVPVSE